MMGRTKTSTLTNGIMVFVCLCRLLLAVPPEADTGSSWDTLVSFRSFDIHLLAKSFMDMRMWNVHQQVTLFLILIVLLFSIVESKSFRDFERRIQPSLVHGTRPRWTANVTFGVKRTSNTCMPVISEEARLQAEMLAMNKELSLLVAGAHPVDGVWSSYT
jgi:hypothetical protein